MNNSIKDKKNFSIKLFVIFACVVLFALTACDKTRFYNKTVQTPKNGWKASDTLYYTFNIQDTTQLYNFYFEVRNTSDYNKQNLYLFITAFYPNKTFSRDTAECLLAAPDGKWLGKGMGKFKDSRFLFRKGVRFRNSGEHTIAVNQAMRDENVQGIKAIGIILKHYDYGKD